MLLPDPVAVAATDFDFVTPLAMPNTKAAMTAARITVMATMRMTPMTGDTASSLFKNFMFTLPSSDRYGALVGYVKNILWYYINISNLLKLH